MPLHSAFTHPVARLRPSPPVAEVKRGWRHTSLGQSNTHKPERGRHQQHTTTPRHGPPIPTIYLGRTEHRPGGPRLIVCADTSCCRRSTTRAYRRKTLVSSSNRADPLPLTTRDTSVMGIIQKCYACHVDDVVSSRSNRMKLLHRRGDGRRCVGRLATWARGS